jgi:hypothetical protein
MSLSNPTSPTGAEVPHVPTVREVVETIGSPMLRVVAAPRGLDFPVRGSLLHDPEDSLPDGTDLLLLVPGLSVGGANALPLLEVSSESGFCAVVVKQHGVDISLLSSEATNLGIALIVAADEVSWRHLDGMLLSVLGSQGIGGSAAGPGDQLFALANALSGVIGGSIAIEDLDRRVMAYSTVPGQEIDSLRQEGILSRRVPEIEHNLERYRIVFGDDSVHHFPAALGALPRTAIAIRAGTQPLGTIWAITPSGGIDGDGVRALIEGTRLAALHILRGRNAEELEFQMRESAVLNALDGKWAANEIAFRLSLSPGANLGLIGFAAMPDASGWLAQVAHLASAISRYVFAFRPDAGVAATARAVYVLLPDGGPEAGLRLARGALSAISKSFGDGVRAAIAGSSSNPMELPAMRLEVDDILRATTSQRDLPDAALLSDVHASVLLGRVGDQYRRESRLRHPGVDAMIDYDKAHSTELARSVLRWLEAGSDTAAAAAALQVHPNTLRYRLRRASELFGVMTEDPDERLATWLQLRVSARP